MSGGRRQRLPLARALPADAPALVLDEPKADLDPSTATELVYVFSAGSVRTVLLVRHRSEELELVDGVLALEAGLGVDHAEPVWRPRWAK